MILSDPANRLWSQGNMLAGEKEAVSGGPSAAREASSDRGRPRVQELFGDVTAIDDILRSGDKRGLVGEQEADDFRDLFRFSQPPHGV